MNLIKCPACQKDISPNAVACPHCGEPVKTTVEKAAGGAINMSDPVHVVGIALMVIMVIGIALYVIVGLAG